MFAINFSETRMKRLRISINAFCIYIFVCSGNNQLAYDVLLSQTEIMFLFFHFLHFLRYVFLRTRCHFFTPEVLVTDLKLQLTLLATSLMGILFESLKIQLNNSIHPSMKANILDIQPLDMVLTKALLN